MEMELARRMTRKEKSCYLIKKTVVTYRESYIYIYIIDGSVIFFYIKCHLVWMKIEVLSYI
jgi:hypothetical protein